MLKLVAEPSPELVSFIAELGLPLSQPTSDLVDLILSIKIVRAKLMAPMNL